MALGVESPTEGPSGEKRQEIGSSAAEAQRAAGRLIDNVVELGSRRETSREAANEIPPLRWVDKKRLLPQASFTHQGNFFLTMPTSIKSEKKKESKIHKT